MECGAEIGACMEIATFRSAVRFFTPILLVSRRQRFGRSESSQYHDPRCLYKAEAWPYVGPFRGCSVLCTMNPDMEYAWADCRYARHVSSSRRVTCGSEIRLRVSGLVGVGGLGRGVYGVVV